MVTRMPFILTSPVAIKTVADFAKARGAVNAVLSLDAAAATRGVITHSSGNHAAASAYAETGSNVYVLCRQI